MILCKLKFLLNYTAVTIINIYKHPNKAVTNFGNKLIGLVMQAGNSNSARLRLTLLQVSCLHYSRN